MSGLETLPLLLASAAVSAAGTIYGGIQAQQAAEFRAKQEEMAAQESRASAQRQALEQRRKGDIVQSRIQALAAASGAGASDPTIVNLGGDVAQRTEYQALTDIYRGENKARGLEDQAAGDRARGDAEFTGSLFKSAGTLLSSGGSIYDKYRRAYG